NPSITLLPILITNVNLISIYIPLKMVWTNKSYVLYSVIVKAYINLIALEGYSMAVDTYTYTKKVQNILDKKSSLFQQSTTQLYKKILNNNEGELTELSAINAKTGKYTGRSPKDKFIVNEPSYRDDIDWGNINQPIEEDTFLKL